MRARARGATVVLITNAPRQSEVVARQLEKMHVPRDTYDAIVSSGDVTRAVIEGRAKPVPSRARTRPLDLRRARATGAARERGLRGLLRSRRRRRGDAGGLS